jgi:hypothetical protein
LLLRGFRVVFLQGMRRHGSPRSSAIDQKGFPQQSTSHGATRRDAQEIVNGWAWSEQ